MLPRVCKLSDLPAKLFCHICAVYNRVFLKIDHFGIDARIVLEQNKFSKNVTSSTD